MQAFYSFSIGLLLGLPPGGGLEVGAVEDEVALVLLGLVPAVVEGTALVGGELPLVGELPTEVGCVVGGCVLPDGVLLTAAVVVWAPSVELGAGELAGSMAANVSFETRHK